MIDAWKSTRSGAWSGRGHHYQHLVCTLILVRQWAGLSNSGSVIPEGFEDCVVEHERGDLWIQVKSRKDGHFTSGEIQKIRSEIGSRVDAVAGLQTADVVVVLEQPCVGLEIVSLDDLFREAPLQAVVCATPGEEIVSVLVSELGIAEILAEGIANDLYRLVAEAAQSNASLSFEKRRGISPSEVERRIFERLEAEDSSAIQGALLSGALEPVDFATPLSGEGFYSGMKVRPGHVSAGLVFDRPSDKSAVVDGLTRRGAVLVSGPSGSGKSALVWLGAEALSRNVRWFEVSGRAAAADVQSIVRFVRSRRPAESSPIGLVFDELVSGNFDIWNILTNALRGSAAVYFLGSVRNEDLPQIANQAEAELYHVELHEELAEAVWEKLRSLEQTDWQYWREPFERSDGLMLEYVHLLTQGNRLREVIADQVRQRELGDREDELAILRGTAVICSLEGEVEARKLFKLLGLEPNVARQALQRLIDEHLVIENQAGVLGGLHALRSAALVEATHDSAVFLVDDSLWRTLPAATNETLPKIIQRILGDPQNEDQALERLAEMLATSDCGAVWVAVLTGLGFGTVERLAASFTSVLTTHRVGKAHWFLASMFADPGIEIPELDSLGEWPVLRDAVLAFRALPRRDLRQECLEHIPAAVSPPTCRDLDQVNTLLSCLVPICGGAPIRLDLAVDELSAGMLDIVKISALLETAYLIDPEDARRLVVAFGGEEVLLDLFREHTPWVTNPVIEHSGLNGRTVRSNLVLLPDDGESDPNDVIVGICARLLALSPDSDAVASDAIDPAGNIVSVGSMQLCVKNIPRNNLPSQTRVAWNVVFRQILLTRSISDGLTEYAVTMSELVGRTEKVFRIFTEKWISGKQIAGADALTQEINSIVEEANALAFATPAELPSTMVEPSANRDAVDSIGALFTGILGNLIQRMAGLPGDEGAKGAAVFAGDLASQARQHEDSRIWRVVQSSPRSKLAAIADRLIDVSSILHEFDRDGTPEAIGRLVGVTRKSLRGNAVRAAALRCRMQAEQHFDERIEALKVALEGQGWNSVCNFRTIDERDSVYWPPREILILVEIEDLEADLRFVDECLEIAHRVLNTDWQFRIAPVMNGVVLSALAVSPISDQVLPDLEFESDWSELIEFPVLRSEMIEKFDRAIGACYQLSAIFACRNLENLHQVEEEAISKAIRTFERARPYFEALAEDSTPEHRTWALDFLDETWNRVAVEYEGAVAGIRAGEPVCLVPYSVLSGDQSEAVIDIAAARLAITEAECRARVEAASPMTSTR